MVQRATSDISHWNVSGVFVWTVGSLVAGVPLAVKYVFTLSFDVYAY